MVENKKELISENFEKIKQIHYLTLEVARLIHALSFSGKEIREILNSQFLCAFKKDIVKATRECGNGMLHAKVETVKRGLVPFIRGGSNFNICFRDKGIFIDTDFTVYGKDEFSFSKLDFIGGIEFIVTTVDTNGTIKDIYTPMPEGKWLENKFLGFGRENSHIFPSFGIPCIVMLLLHYPNYSEELCREYATINEFQKLKNSCMKMGEKLFDKEILEIDNLRDSSWSTSVNTNIEMPERLEEVDFDFFSGNSKTALLSSNIFVGDFIGLNASNKKKLENLKDYFFNFDFSHEEILSMNKKLKDNIKELQEIRQLMAGFIELYKSKIFFATL